MTDQRIDMERDDHVPLAPLPQGDSQPPGGIPPAPPGTDTFGKPDPPEATPFEALVNTGRWRGFLYKSELVAFLELLDEQGAMPYLGLWEDPTGAPLRRKDAVKALSRRLREMGIPVRRG